MLHKTTYRQNIDPAAKPKTAIRNGRITTVYPATRLVSKSALYDSGVNIKKTSTNNTSIDQQVTSSINVGNNIDSQGNLTINSGESLVINNIDLDAKGNITLLTDKDFITEATRSVINNDVVDQVNITAGGDLLIGAKQNVRNSLTTLSADNITIDAGRDVTNSATQITSENNVFINAGGDAANSATQIISGNGVSINAGRDVDNSEVVITTENNIYIDAGRDVTNSAAQITSGSNVSINADRNLNIDTVAREVKTGSSRNRRETITHEGSALASVGNIQLNAGNDLEVTGSTLNAGEDIAISAKGDTLITAAQDELYTYRKKTKRSKAGTKKKTTIKETFNTTNVASELNAGGNVTINIDIASDGRLIKKDSGTVRVEGSNINAQQKAVLAGSDVDVVDKKEINFYSSQTKKSSFGGLKNSKTRSFDRNEIVRSSNVTTDEQNLDLIASNDINILGSSVAAGGDTTLTAGGDVTIAAAEQTSEAFYKKETSRIGFFSNGGVSLSFGKQSSDLKQTTNIVEQVSSTVGAVQGDVTINAGKDATISASDVLVTQGDIRVNANNIHLEAKQDQYAYDETLKQKSAGVSVALSGGVVDTVTTLNNSARRIDETDNKTLQALHAFKAASAAGDVGQGVEDLKNIGQDITTVKEQLGSIGIGPGGSNETPPADASQKDEAPKTSGINVSASIGSSSSKSTTQVRSNTAVGSSLVANGDIVLNATGDGSDNSGNIITEGAIINGDNVNLNAANELRLSSAENTNTHQQDSKSSSGAVGISAGSGGLNVFVEGSRSTGETNQSDDQFLETQITANNTASLTSGGDTTLEGAQVKANTIKADVGGDLTIISQQDQSQFEQQDNSVGGKLGVGIGGGPITLSANASKLEADANYQAVQEQSGLFAGEGGFDITVENNTHLEGGAIVSDASADNNTFGTDTLSTQNIDNVSEYDIESDSVGFSIDTSASVANNLKDNTKQKVVQGLAGGAANDSDSASNTTQSVISDGVIDIRSGDEAVLASIETDKDKAHQVLNHLFDVDKVQELEDQTEATQLFAEEAFTYIGDQYADLENAEAVLADKEKEDNVSEEQLASLREQVQREKDKLFVSKPIAHALAGGVTAVIGGGSFLDGALASGLNEAAAKKLANELPNSPLLKNAIASLVGGAVGGTQGALIAGSADKFNRQLHPTEIDLIKANAEAFAEDQNLDVATAERQLTQAFLSEADASWALSYQREGVVISENALAYIDNTLRDSTHFVVKDGDRNNRLLNIDGVHSNFDFYVDNAASDQGRDLISLNAEGGLRSNSVFESSRQSSGAETEKEINQATNTAIATTLETLPDQLADKASGVAEAGVQLLTDPAGFVNRVGGEVEAIADGAGKVVENYKRREQAEQDTADTFVLELLEGDAEGAGIIQGRYDAVEESKVTNAVASTLLGGGLVGGTTRQLPSKGVDTKQNESIVPDSKVDSRQAQSDGPEGSTVNANGPRDELTGPYNPNTTRADLEATHGADNVLSSTNPNNPRQSVTSFPDRGIEVIHGADGGKAVRVQFDDPVTGQPTTANIPYNDRGLPIFDNHTKYTTTIDKTKSYDGQLRQATRDLREAIDSGKVDSSRFTVNQLQDIRSGSEKIDDFTWHHNADSGNMQLVPFDVHDAVKHIGDGALSEGR